MKEKDMLKNMFEQEHKSTALDLSADEVLNAKLGKGARVRSRGFAGAAIAAAAVLAVGVGVFALNSGMETADADSKSPVSETTAAVTAARAADTSVYDKYADGNQMCAEIDEHDLSGLPLQPMSEQDYYDELYADGSTFITVQDTNYPGAKYKCFKGDAEYAADVKRTMERYFNGTIEPLSIIRYKGDDRSKVTGFYDDTLYYQVFVKRQCHTLSYKSDNGKYVTIYSAVGGYDDRCYVCVYDEKPEGDLKKAAGELLTFESSSTLAQLYETLWNRDYTYYFMHNEMDMYTIKVRTTESDVSVKVNFDDDEDLEDFGFLCEWADGFVKAPASEVQCPAEYEQTAVYVELSGNNNNVKIYRLLDENNKGLYKIVVNDSDEYYLGNDCFGSLFGAAKTKIRNAPDSKEKLSDDPVTTTVTKDIKDDYTPDEIQPLPRGEIDFADKPVIVHFTRSVDSSLPQADMSFRLIDEYDDLLKGMYADYKSGELKPAATLTMDDEPEGITGGTAMTVYWTRDDGGMVEFMGVDMDGQKAYIRLTDLDENDTCATGKVHYFSTDSEMYQMLWKIWGFYYPVYENVDEMP